MSDFIISFRFFGFLPDFLQFLFCPKIERKLVSDFIISFRFFGFLSIYFTISILSQNRAKVSVRCPSILRLETTMESLTRMIARPPLTYQSRQEFSSPDFPYLFIENTQKYVCSCWRCCGPFLFNLNDINRTIVVWISCEWYVVIPGYNLIYFFT